MLLDLLTVPNTLCSELIKFPYSGEEQRRIARAHPRRGGEGEEVAAGLQPQQIEI
jgi:hypothetical protein